MKCPKCGKELADGAKFCMYCGTRVEKKTETKAGPEKMREEIRCPNCGAAAGPNDHFCQWCGSPLKRDAADDAKQNASEVNHGVRNYGDYEYFGESKESDSRQNRSARSGPRDSDYTYVRYGSRRNPNPSYARYGSRWNPDPSYARYGNRRNPDSSDTQYDWQQNSRAMYSGTSRSSGRKKGAGGKISIKLIAGICAAAAAVIVLAVVAVIGSHTIDLNQYLSVSFKGGNTKGKAEVQFDEDQFIQDCSKIVRLNPKKIAEYQDAAENSGIDADELADADSSEAAELLIAACIDGELSQDEDLSNGDQIIYQWDTRDDLAKDVFGVRLKHSDQTFTVSNLPKLQKVDLFDGVTVRFSGVEPNGTAEIEVDNVYGNDYGIYYELDKNSGLSEGDKVTVTARVSDFGGDVEDALADNGYTADAIKKEYTVSGLSTYVTSADEIPEETLEALKKQTEDLITADTATDSEIDVLSRDYLGNYFFTAKSESADTQNVLVLVYSVSTRVPVGSGESTQDVTYYTCGIFENLLMNGDEVEYDLTEGTLPNDSYIYRTEGHWFWVYGYESQDDLKSSIVDQNSSEFNVEDHINS